MIKAIIIVAVLLVAIIGIMRKSKDVVDVEKPGPVRPPSTDQA